MNKKYYVIGDKKYYQKKLVMGQLQQLTKAIEGVKFGGDLNIASLINVLGDKLSKVFAIVLIPVEIGNPKEKNLDEICDYLDSNMDIDTAFEVAQDFFDYNQIQSVLERLTKMMQGLTAKTTSKKRA